MMITPAKTPIAGRHKPLVSIVAALALLGVSSGCTTEQQPSEPEDPMTALLARLHSGDADPSQIAIFEGDEITFEDYELAMNRAFDCMREAGYKVHVDGITERGGVPQIDYLIEAEAGLELSDTSPNQFCWERYAGEVDTYWQAIQPDAIAWNEQRNAALRPGLIACMNREGIDHSDDADTDELIHVAAIHTIMDGGHDCIDEAGYEEWQQE